MRLHPQLVLALLLQAAPVAADVPSLDCPRGMELRRQVAETKYMDREQLWCQKKGGGRNGPFVERHLPTGRRTARGQYLYGRRVGRWTWWYPGGRKKREGVYEHSRQVGVWTAWYENGQKRYAGRYDRGRRHGLWTFWWSNGQKMRECNYRDNNCHRWTFWDGSGAKVVIECPRRAVLTVGAGQGKTWLVCIRDKTMKHGAYESFYANGHRFQQGTYRKDVKNGLWTEWRPDGQRLEEKAYEKGHEQGRWIRWHPNGNKWIEAELQRSKLHGRWVRYYPSGQKQEEGHFHANKRCGQWVCWSQDGSWTPCDYKLDLPHCPFAPPP